MVRHRRRCPVGEIYFQSRNVAIRRNVRVAVSVTVCRAVLSKAAGRIRARGEKERHSPTWPIFFRQYWPSLYSGWRTKNSCGFHVARRRNNVDTGRVANPGCSTRRLDYTADLSKALSALSPRTTLRGNRDLYSGRERPPLSGKKFFRCYTTTRLSFPSLCLAIFFSSEKIKNYTRFRAHDSGNTRWFTGRKISVVLLA